MILKALYDYYQRCDDVAPEGFEFKEIGFLIVINNDGDFLRIEDCRIDKKTCKTFLVPKTVNRSGSKSGMFPCLMWDNTHFVLGTPKGDKPNPEGQYLTAFRQKVKELAEKYPNNSTFATVHKFYMKHDGNDLSSIFTNDVLCNDLLATNKNISFRIAGSLKIVAEDEDLRNELKETDENNNGREVCLITGKKSEIARTHSKTPLPGYTFSSLISFQKNYGFDSYGKEQAYNAPTSKEAEFAYTTALNTMLARDSHNKFSIGDRTYVFWASSNNDSCKQAEESVFSLFGFQEKNEDDPNRNIMMVREVFNAIYSGKIKTTLEDKFYILGLAPNSARIAVVYWSETSLKDFAGMLMKHFDDMEVVDTRQNKHPYMGLKDMLGAVTLGGKHTDAAPNLPDAVVKSIFQGLPYPYTLFSSAIRRIRAESAIGNSVWTGRAAILKAYLNRLNDNNNKNIQTMLDKENTNQGYLCGRLFAVLDSVEVKSKQIKPGDNVKHNLQERYMNSASATPAAVFATILNLSSHHSEKLNEGAKIFYEKLKQEIMSKLPADGFPAHLDLQDQGRFFVGFYHQRQDLFTSKKEDNNVTE